LYKLEIRAAYDNIVYYNSGEEKIAHVRKTDSNLQFISDRNLKVNKNETKAISSSAYIMKDATKAEIEIFYSCLEFFVSV